MIDTPQITQSVAQRTAIIRLTIPRDEIRLIMGPAIGEVMAAVAAQGIGPVGPVFSQHFRMDPEIFDFEVGVPVTQPVTPVGRVQPGKLPATTKRVRSITAPTKGSAPPGESLAPGSLPTGTPLPRTSGSVTSRAQNRVSIRQLGARSSTGRSTPSLDQSAPTCLAIQQIQHLARRS